MGFSAFVPLVRSSKRVPKEALRTCLGALVQRELTYGRGWRLTIDDGVTRSEQAITFRSSAWRRALGALVNVSVEDRDAVGNAMADLETAQGDQLVRTSRESAGEARLPDLALQFEAPSATRTLRAAYRYLSLGGYPRPFSLNTFWIEDGALRWGPALPGFGSPTFYGLSPTNSDLSSDIGALAREQHGDAVRAYRLIELAHDIRWLASASLPSTTCRRIRDLAPEDGPNATRLLVMRATEFGAAAAEWIARVEIARLNAQHAADMPLAGVNARRVQAAAAWRPLALKRYNQLRDLAPNATLRAVAEIVTTELRRDPTVEVSDRTVYQYLWEESRRVRKG